jgi:hypothetical protein
VPNRGKKLIGVTAKVKPQVQCEGYTVNHYLRTFMAVTVLPFTKKTDKVIRTYGVSEITSNLYAEFTNKQ